ncbi:hypothetical protein Sjap_009510 [Stephania japonica]|uniref:Uncharacterized protein n=1 Tax=Stephania japonica TaxID=461633 RepID=A0AAP0JS45_9MAGN
MLQLSNNRLTGPLPSGIGNMSRLIYLHLSNNQLTGNLPVELGKLPNLRMLYLSANVFYGSIPNSLCNITSLEMLDLHENHFHALLHAFQNAINLVSLIVHGNQLHGQIPRSLAHCKKLKILDLGNNMMYDKFPCWLESLPAVRILLLRSNKFYGPLKCLKTEHGFQKLHMLDLSSNDFTGYLPKEFFQGWESMRNGIASNDSNFKEEVVTLRFNFTTTLRYNNYVTVGVMNKGQYMLLNKSLDIFAFLDLSNNHFEGEISEAFGELKSLIALNLSCNNFTGRIPLSIGNLLNLQALDLSQNKLSGEIPNQLTSLTFLAVLNLSINQLTGVIPRGNQFNTFSNDSYEGNPGLCGFPLSKQCKHVDVNLPPETLDEDDAESKIKLDKKFMLMGYGSGLVIGFSIGYVMLRSDNRILAKIFKFLYYYRIVRL